jgi:hypothetical protein
MPELQDKSAHALVECCLWLHIGFIGATALAAGLQQLFAGGWVGAWALVLSGGVLTAASWRRSRSTLEQPGQASATFTDAASAPIAREHSTQIGGVALSASCESAAIHPKARSCS